MNAQEVIVGFNRAYVKRISVGRTIKGISYYSPFTRIDFTDSTFLHLNLNYGLRHNNLIQAEAYAELNITGYDKNGSVIASGEDE